MQHRKNDNNSLISRIQHESEVEWSQQQDTRSFWRQVKLAVISGVLIAIATALGSWCLTGSLTLLRHVQISIDFR